MALGESGYGEPLENSVAVRAVRFTGQLTYQMREAADDSFG